MELLQAKCVLAAEVFPAEREMGAHGEVGGAARRDGEAARPIPPPQPPHLPRAVPSEVLRAWTVRGDASLPKAHLGAGTQNEAAPQPPQSPQKADREAFNNQH